MKVGELVELLENCYEDADVVLFNEELESTFDIDGVDFDDVENKAFINF